MPNKNPPILQFDPSTDAIIDPAKVHPFCNAPPNCIVCFFGREFELLREVDNLTPIGDMSGEGGLKNLYKFESNNKEIAIFHPGVGAALAGGNLEVAIGYGCRNFIAIGSAGVLNGSIELGSLLVPTSAVRDEGTSYHYLPPSQEARANLNAVDSLTKVLDNRSLSYQKCKTWTTDGPYRETFEKINRRRNEGCLTVEMEAAAFFAVAEFREVQLAQLLYAGDDVSGKEWKNRKWTSAHDVRHEMFEIAVDYCMESI